MDPTLKFLLALAGFAVWFLAMFAFAIRLYDGKWPWGKRDRNIW